MILVTPCTGVCFGVLVKLKFGTEKKTEKDLQYSIYPSRPQNAHHKIITMHVEQPRSVKNMLPFKYFRRHRIPYHVKQDYGTHPDDERKKNFLCADLTYENYRCNKTACCTSYTSSKELPIFMQQPLK